MLESIFRIISRFVKRPIKIALVNAGYPLEKATISGPTVNTRNLARNLAMLGCEVHVFCSSQNGKDKKIRERLGEGKVIVHALRIDTGIETSNPAVNQRLRWYAFETRALNDILWENSKRWFDIIHTQNWPSTGFMLKHFSNMNWVHTFRALEKYRLTKMTKKESRFAPMHQWIEETVTFADRIVCVSERFREEVIKRIKGIARKTSFIYNGIDLDVFKPSTNNRPTVLFVGRFSKEKGVDMLPEIIEKVLKKDTKYKFIMVSSGETDLPELKAIKEKLERLETKYKNRFIWYKEALHQEELAKIHSKSSVYVQPSIYEPFGNTVLEAIATGKATVVTDVGGMPEIVGKAGFVAKVNAKDIANKILKLLADPKLRKKYRALAVERAKEFEWKKIAKQYLDLYKEILVERRKERLEKELKLLRLGKKEERPETKELKKESEEKKEEKQRLSSIF